MQCRQCEYTLWEIHGRVCPECGHPFRPSEYEFTPNTVRFRCPHCDQNYYGTDGKGHLEPRAFRCVKCAIDVEMDEMVLSPAAGVPDHVVTLHTKNPWEKRRGFGVFRAAVTTVLMAMFKPAELMKQTSPRGSLTSAMWFAVFANICFVVIGSGLGLLAMALFAGAVGGGMGVMAVSMWLWLLAMVVIGGVGITVGILFWGLASHAILRLTGGTRHQVDRTIIAVSYSSGANALQAVPIIGFYLMLVSWIWWAISAAIMLKEGQRVSGLRAAFAAFTPPVILFVIVVGGAYLSVAHSIGSLQGRINSATETQLVTDALVAAIQSGGAPAHGAALVADSRISAYDLVLMETNTYPDTIAVGALSLEDLENASLREVEAAVQAAAATLPTDVVAHRLGDFVFTYHGVDINDPNNSGRWIVVCWPDPDTNAPPDSQSIIWIGQSDGLETLSLVSAFQSALDDENQARRDAGLPEIPHPMTVLHSAPASAAIAP